MAAPTAGGAPPWECRGTDRGAKATRAFAWSTICSGFNAYRAAYPCLPLGGFPLGTAVAFMMVKLLAHLMKLQA
jgi:hypothetical protein